jgi:tetratricopeptide (TPR) repeat protein
VLDSRYVLGGRTGEALPEYLSWAERARSYVDPETVDRIYANLALSNAWEGRETTGHFQAVLELRLEALAVARQLGDREALFRSAHLLLRGYFAPQHVTERLRLAEEASSWPREGVSSQTLGSVLWVAGMRLLAEGGRDRAEKLWRQIEDVAERTRVVSINVYLDQRDALLSIVDGRLEEALVLLQRLVEHADESGSPVRGRQVAIQMQVAAALYVGRAEAWLMWFGEYAERAGDYAQTAAFLAARAVCLGHLGRRDEARGLVEPLLDTVESESDEVERPMAALTMLLQAANLLGQKKAALALSARLACVAHMSAAWASGYACVARLLGDAAVLLGDRPAARAYYTQALGVSTKLLLAADFDDARESGIGGAD